MPVWARIAVVIGGAKCRARDDALLVGSRGSDTPAPVPVWIYAVLSAIFAVLGGLLVVGNRHDPRAAWLGGILVLTAAPLAPLVNGFPAWGFPSYARPEALLAAFLLRFVAISFAADRRTLPHRAPAAVVALTVGLWCVAVDLLPIWMPAVSSDFRIAPFLVPDGTGH